MKDNSFKYCILKYVHSQLLMESVNIGIFFQFSNGEFYFKHPDRFDRIKGMYRDFDEEQLKDWLSALEANIETMNRSVNRANFLLSDMIRKDATVLQLGNISTSLGISEDYKGVADNYYDLYFKEHHNNPVTLKTEA